MMTKKKSQKSEKTSQVKLAKHVAESKTLLDKAHVAFGDIAPNLTSDQKKRQPKPRPGIATVLPTIAVLIEKYGAVVPMHSVVTMKSHLETVTMLEPLRIAAETFLRKVENAQSYANGEAWGSATAFYTVLRRVEGKDDQLATALKPVASYFAKRKPSSKGSAPAKSASNGSAPVTAPVTNGSASPDTSTTHA